MVYIREEATGLPLPAPTESAGNGGPVQYRYFVLCPVGPGLERSEVGDADGLAQVDALAGGNAYQDGHGPVAGAGGLAVGVFAGGRENLPAQAQAPAAVAGLGWASG
jgi:hypothetical protein